MTPLKNHLTETVLLRGHSLCFNGEIIWKISPKISLLPLSNTSAMTYSRSIITATGILVNAAFSWLEDGVIFSLQNDFKS